MSATAAADPANTARVLMWDYREQPDLDALARAVLEVSDGLVHIREADTGGQEYAIVITDRALSASEATAAFRAWEES